MSEIRSTSSVCRAINKDWGEIVHRGFKADKAKVDLNSLGSISLDYCCYGGIHPGRFVEISGGEGSGKTTICFSTMGAFMRSHPDTDVLFVDLEGTFDPTWAQKVGLDTENEHFIYYETIGQSGEKILNHIVEFIRAGVGLVVIDSLPMLIPEFVQKEDDMEQKSMGGNAKLLSDFTARYTGLLHKTGATVIGINQIRDNMTQYGDPIKTTGGRAWKHACSLRLMAKRGDFFDQNGDKVKKKDAQSPAGHYIEMYVLKNKDAPWDRKLGFTKLHYWKGIDFISDLTEVAITFGLIDNSKVGWFQLLNEDGSPMADENGEIIKINGRAKLTEYLKEHREVSTKLYYKAKELMEVKESGYAEAFESLLGVDTSNLRYDGEGENE